MTKDEIKNRISMALKDSILQQGFEIICKENSTLDKSLITSTKNNIERQRIIDKLKEENAELKILLKQCYQYHLHPEVFEYPYDDVEKFFNEEGLC